MTTPKKSEKERRTHFYFVQITDTHLEDKKSLRELGKVVDLINDLPLDIEFVVHTGDITHYRIEDKKLLLKTRMILNKIEMPKHFIPGNHDIIPSRLSSNIYAFKKEFGDLSTTAEYHGVQMLFIYFDFTNGSSSLVNHEIFEWSEQMLEETRGKPMLIFLHSPPVDFLHNSRFGGGWPKEIYDKWESLVNSFNVQAIITGHYHREFLQWIGNVPLYVSASLKKFNDRPSTFRVYEYQDGKIGYWTQYLYSNRDVIRRGIKKIKKIWISR